MCVRSDSHGWRRAARIDFELLDGLAGGDAPHVRENQVFALLGAVDEAGDFQTDVVGRGVNDQPRAQGELDLLVARLHLGPGDVAVVVLVEVQVGVEPFERHFPVAGDGLAFDSQLEA